MLDKDLCSYNSQAFLGWRRELSDVLAFEITEQRSQSKTKQMRHQLLTPSPTRSLFLFLIQIQVLHCPQSSSLVQSQPALAFPSESQCILFDPPVASLCQV